MPSVFWNPDSDTIWISRPSRIHDTPSPKTTDQWNFVHGSRSMRAGTRLLMAPSVRCATASLIPISFDPNRCEPSGQGARRRVLTAGSRTPSGKPRNTFRTTGRFRPQRGARSWSAASFLLVVVGLHDLGLLDEVALVAGRQGAFGDGRLERVGEEHVGAVGLDRLVVGHLRLSAVELAGVGAAGVALT